MQIRNSPAAEPSTQLKGRKLSEQKRLNLFISKEKDEMDVWTRLSRKENVFRASAEQYWSNNTRVFKEFSYAEYISPLWIKWSFVCLTLPNRYSENSNLSLKFCVAFCSHFWKSYARKAESLFSIVFNFSSNTNFNLIFCVGFCNAIAKFYTKKKDIYPWNRSVVSESIEMFG